MVHFTERQGSRVQISSGAPIQQRVQILNGRTLRKAAVLAALAFFILNVVPSSETVSGTHPLAAFTYNPCVACAAPGAVVFFNANTSRATNGQIPSYTWDFGDGSSPVKTNSSYQTHDFLLATPGKWQVTLTVQDSNGITDTISQLVLFNVAPDFTIQPSQPPVGFPVTFNTSSSPVCCTRTLQSYAHSGYQSGSSSHI